MAGVAETTDVFELRIRFFVVCDDYPSAPGWLARLIEKYDAGDSEVWYWIIAFSCLAIMAHVQLYALSSPAFLP